MPLAHKKIALCGRAGSGKTTLARILVEEYGYTQVSFAAGVKQCFADVFEPVLGRKLDKGIDRIALQYIGKYGRSVYDLDWFQEFGLPFEEEYSRNNHLTPEQQFILFDKLDDWFINRTTLLGYDLADAEHENMLDAMVAAANLPKDYTNDFWIRLAKHEMTKHELVVVDDMRFHNERNLLSNMGFKIVRLELHRNDAEDRMLKRDGYVDPKMWDNESEKEYFDFIVDYEIDASNPLEIVKEDILQYVNN